MDACMMMEQHIGCGYTYMLTFSGNLLIVLYKLLEQKIFLFEVGNVISLIREDCKKIIEAIKVPVATMISDDFDNNTNKTHKILVNRLSNRDKYSSGHNVMIVKKLVSQTLDLLSLCDSSNNNKPITINGIRKRIQIVTLGGKYVEKSSISYGVMVPMSPQNFFHWMTEYKSSFENGKIYRAGIVKGDDVLHMPVAADNVQLNKNDEIYLDIDASYLDFVNKQNCQKHAKYAHLIQHLKRLNVHILFTTGNNNMDKQFLSLCKKNKIIVLNNLSSIDVEKIALLVDGSVTPSIMQLSNESIGCKTINISPVDTGWMDSTDAIYTTAKMNSKSTNSRESVSYLHIQIVLPEKNCTFEKTPISIVLFHSIYVMCKDMEILFWNMLFRNYNTLISQHALPGKGYTEVCLYHVLKLKSKLYQNAYQQQQQQQQQHNQKKKQYNDDNALLVKSFIYNEVATIFQSQYLKVLENCGETFENSLLDFAEKLELVKKTVLPSTCMNENGDDIHLNSINCDKFNIYTNSEMVFHKQRQKQEMFDGSCVYDCYMSKVDGLSKGFETCLLIMKCDTIIMNS